MRKIILFGMLILTFVVNALFVSSWTDCSPPECTSDYVDYGVNCIGSTCYRNCTANICDENWINVHYSNLSFSNDVDEYANTSESYTPVNSSNCYKFFYVGPPIVNPNYIDIHVSPPPSGDCDSEMIGGFINELTPWYSGMNNFVGGSLSNSKVNNMIKEVRAHSEANADQTYMDDAAKNGSIYCAPRPVACGALGGSSICDTDCYNLSLQGRVVQGYYKDKGTPDNSLYSGDKCGSTYVSLNRMISVNYSVYESTATTGYENDTSCARTNEAPSAFNVTVLPSNATLGHDPFCDYAYYDPESYTEKDSSYEWWKNGVNQNFNSIILNKGNLTLGDNWYCKVKPNDGLLDGNLTQSGNNITILSTVKDIQMYVNGTWVWNTSGYFVGPQIVLNFTDALNQAIQDCVPDAENYCTINLTYSSTAAGQLNLSRMRIYYRTPQNYPPIINGIILNSTNPLTNDTSQNLTLYLFNVSDLDNQSIKNITTWYINNTAIIVLNMPFEGGSNASWTKDNSPFGYSGTVYGNPIWNNTLGHDGFGAYQFDGIDDFINLGISGFDFNSSFAVSAWIKSAGSSGNYTLITKKYDAGVTPFRLSFSAVTNLSPYGFGVFNGSQWFATGTSGRENDGNWHFIVGQYDGTYLKYYIDGVLNRTKTFNQPLPNNDAFLLVGKSSNNDLFNGTIDDIQIWNRSLSASQIKILYEKNTNLIVSEETISGEIWQACVAPNDGIEDGPEKCSNILAII